MRRERCSRVFLLVDEKPLFFFFNAGNLDFVLETKSEELWQATSRAIGKTIFFSFAAFSFLNFTLSLGEDARARAHKGAPPKKHF